MLWHVSGNLHSPYYIKLLFHLILTLAGDPSPSVGMQFPETFAATFADTLVSRVFPHRKRILLTWLHTQLDGIWSYRWLVTNYANTTVLALMPKYARCAAKDAGRAHVELP